MRIRILIITTILIVVSTIFYAGYLYFKPSPAPLVLVDYARVLSFDYYDINDHISKEDKTYYLWFCDGGVNCKFVNDNMLRPLSTQIRTEDFPDLIFVDMSNIRSDISPARLNNDWGFTSYPAFVTVEMQQGQKTILNTLFWTPAEPFGKNEIKQWMIDNGIWKGPIN